MSPSARFSSRLRWSQEPNALARAIERRGGAPFLDLTLSNPTAAGFSLPGEPVLAALANPRSLVYRPDARGLRVAREAVANHLAGLGGAPVSPDRIVLTASSSEAYGWLFALLCDPGEGIAVPTPSYPLFEYLAGLAGVALRPYRLAYDGRWHVDRTSVRDAVDRDVRAVVAIHPNNPTGSYLSQDELRFLSATCAERGLALVCDEVFFEHALGVDSERAGSAAFQDGCLSFTLGGLSKCAGLPQLKLGWIAVSGPTGEVDAALVRLELIADSYLSPSAPVQFAAPTLLALAPAFRSSVAARLRANLETARRLLAPPAGANPLHVDGGWTLPLRLPATQTGEAWALELLEGEGVLVQPGYFYDFEGEAYVVVSLLTPESDFATGMARLRASVDRAIAG